ncbi:MAG: YafY family transcriptional regulator [Acidobacteriota bacterium]|jgi:predicted DNA-binding transcriptional regulator YafY|nr:YafY family transcriptional regulator [Acidobacteriota bacterium]
MQINRLFEIVYLLMDRKRVTANELASHFEVSKRTILRDVDALTMAGIPIYTTQGKGGGIFIQDHFVLNKTLISEDEQKQILFSLQSMSATEFMETKQVLGRLRSLFAGPGKDWIEVDFSRWGHSAADNTKFEMLKHAILNEFAVSFDYLSAYGESKGREVYPLKLSFKSKAWYLQSFCLSENDYRVFKFNRMSNMIVLDTSFHGGDYEVPTIEPAEDPSSLNLIDVKIFVSSHAKYRIYDEFAESDITVNEDGSFTLRMTQGQWIYDYILSYGTAVEVLEPQYIRDELLIRIEKIKHKYWLKT